MIWLIIGLIISIVVTVSNFREYCFDWFEKIFFSVLESILAVAISLLVLLGASAITSCFADVDYNMVSDTKIIALKDNQNVNGNFYIMGGYVDEKLYYYYATETELGYKTEKVNAENSYIKYTDGESHIEEYEAKFVNDYIYLFAAPMQLDRYIIYCPEGTVTNEFNVDLE